MQSEQMTKSNMKLNRVYSVIILLNSSQLTTHVVENEQKKLVIMTSTFNIISWDEQH